MIDSFNKLSIGKYLEIVDIIEDDSLAEIDKNVALVAVLDGKEVDVIYDLPLTEFNEKIQKTDFLYQEPKPTMVSTTYKFGNMTLETVLDLNKLTTAQFVDYQTYLKDIKKYLVELLSVFLIPKGKKYGKDYDVVEVQKAIRENMPITDALGLSAFFLALYKALYETTLTSLIKKMKKMKKKEKNEEKILMMEEAIANLEKSGDGWRLLTEQAKP